MTRAGAHKAKQAERAAMRALLRKLPLPNTSRQLRALMHWTEWPDFPGPAERTAEKVLAWIEANALKIERYWQGVNLASGRVKLTPAGALQRGGEGRPQASYAETQATLAAALAHHYNGRVSIVIDEPRISQWRRGQRLPAGAPPPPERGASGWPIGDWIRWFDAHLLPVYALARQPADAAQPPAGAPEADLHARLARMELQDKLDELAERARQREIERGLWVRKEEVRRAAERLGERVNAALNLHLDRIFEARLRQTINSLGLEPTQADALLNLTLETARSATDAVKDALRSGLLEEHL